MMVFITKIGSLFLFLKRRHWAVLVSLPRVERLDANKIFFSVSRHWAEPTQSNISTPK